MKIIIRKNIFFIALFLVYATTTIAQTNTTVSGTVTDKNSYIEFATVVVYSSTDSSKPVRGSVTDSFGRFTISNLSFGNYFLKIQMLGFQSYKINFQLTETNSTIDLKNVELIADNNSLGGVTVIAHRALIKKNTEGFITQAKDHISQSGGTASDLLKNTPTVVVDAEGAITIRGKVPLILINGRNSVLGSTDRIPASSVESIEIINNPSSKYDADADGGIINIKLKKNTANGLNGAVALGGGVGAKGRVSSSAILNFKKGQWNLGLAYDNRFSGRTRSRQANRTDYDIPDQYYLKQYRFDNRLEQTQNLKFNVDFQPNEKNLFSFETIENLEGEDNDETLYSMFRTKTDIFTSNNSRFSKEKVRHKAMEFALNYQRKFKDERKYLTANISSSFDFDRENTDLTTQSRYEDGNLLGTPFLQQTYDYRNSNVSNFKIDFGQPVTKKKLIEIGYKGITRFTDADFQNLYFTNNQYTTNLTASNIFNFREQVHAAYLQYGGYIGNEDSVKWKYDFGLRAEYVFNDGEGVSNNILVTRNYFNLFPTANISCYFTKSDYLKLSFSRRINRPDLGDLNPFVDITDLLNRHGGNPYLKPELINAFEFGYNKVWKKGSLSTNLFYRYATNIIRPFITLNSNGVTLMLPMNFGNATTYGIEEIASFSPFKRWNANLSLSFYQQQISGNNVSTEIANNTFSWYGKVINNFILWQGSQLQLIGNYNAPVGTPQGISIEIYYADIGFRQTILKNKGALGLVITDVFNTQRSGYIATASNYTYTRFFKIDTRAIMLTFAYTFGTTFKEEILENKFKND